MKKKDGVYRLGGSTFMRQEDISTEIQRILHSNEIGTMITGKDEELLRELFEYHPTQGKLGDGIESIEVRNAKYKNQREFWIHRIGAVPTDVSYVKCIRSFSPESQVKRAMRLSIDEQTKEYRRAYYQKSEQCGLAPCEECGKEVNIADSHVDHIFPETFDKLVLKFLDLNHLAFEDVSITQSEAGIPGRRLNDSDLEERWCEYHKDNCKLRLVCKSCSLSAQRK